MSIAQIKEISIFICYGLILSFFNFKYMGYGQGIYVPMALYSSPLGYLGIKFAFCGTPIFWGIVGFCVSRANLLFLKFTISIITIHYVSFFILSFNFRDWNDWGNFANTDLMHVMLKYLIAGFIIYAIGQIYLWYRIINGFSATTTP